MSPAPPCPRERLRMWPQPAKIRQLCGLIAQTPSRFERLRRTVGASADGDRLKPARHSEHASRAALIKQSVIQHRRQPSAAAQVGQAISPLMWESKGSPITGAISTRSQAKALTDTVHFL